MSHIFKKSFQKINWWLCENVSYTYMFENAMFFTVLSVSILVYLHTFHDSLNILDGNESVGQSSNVAP